MKKRQIIVLLVAAIIAITGGFFVGKVYLQKASQTNIVVAKEAMYPGHIIQPGDVTYIEISTDAVQPMPGALKSTHDAIGKMVNTTIVPGEYISNIFFAKEDLGAIYKKMLSPGESILTVSGSPFNLNIASLYPGAKVAIFQAGRKDSPICYGRVIDFSGKQVKGWSDAAHGEYKGDYVVLAVDSGELPSIVQIMPNVYIAVMSK